VGCRLNRRAAALLRALDARSRWREWLPGFVRHDACWPGWTGERAPFPPADRRTSVPSS